MKTSVQCVQVANAVLGECPVWDHRARALYWIDVKRPAVYRWEPEGGQSGQWRMPVMIGCLGLCESSRGLIADVEGFGFLDIRSGQVSRLSDPEPDLAANLFNDGKVDRRGRFWAGSMHESGTLPTGSLYRVDPDLRVRRMREGFHCPNGLGWSLDERTMYVTDSTIRTIWAYEFDGPSGDLGPRRVFARLASEDGLPDGLTVDQEGYVWSAIWDGWRLLRFDPNGNVERELRLPVQRPTSCVFGGENFETLFVTSASDELSNAELAQGPLAGSLFAVRAGCAGLPEGKFCDA